MAMFKVQTIYATVTAQTKYTTGQSLMKNTQKDSNTMLAMASLTLSPLGPTPVRSEVNYGNYGNIARHAVA